MVILQQVNMISNFRIHINIKKITDINPPVKFPLCFSWPHSCQCPGMVWWFES